MSPPTLFQSAARRHPLSSLATKIILLVFGSTFVTALVVSWVSIQSTHDALRDMIDRLYPLSLAHAGVSVAAELEEGRNALGVLAGERALLAEPRAQERALARAFERSSTWRGLARVAADGRLTAWVGAQPDILDGSSPPRAGPLRLADGSDAVALTWPLPSGGALLGILDPEALARSLVTYLPDASSFLAIVDRQGRVLVGSGTPPETPRLSLPATIDSEPRPREYASGGRQVIGAALPVGTDGWQLVLETPFEVAFAPVLAVVSRIFVIDLFVILVFSFLAYRVTGAVVRPIERLSDWARRIAQGQLDLEIPETGGRDEIGLLARTFNDMMRQLRRNHREIETTNRDLTDRNLRLQQANEVLNQLSITDGLTKLHNHRFFQDQLTREIKRVSRTGDALSMLLIDIDDFKQLNDRFGHAAGDELLTRMAPLLNAAVRETDLAARYGGEEFVVLAPNTDVQAPIGWPRRSARPSQRRPSSSTTRCGPCASPSRSAWRPSMATARSSSARPTTPSTGPRPRARTVSS
jgi:GGDEF domain-containing protein/HAMP domain-containing protein